MTLADRLEIVRDAYRAYESGDRDLIEGVLSDDYTFFSPYDAGIDRERYFERCWPNADQLQDFELVRMIESGDEVVVTYESTRKDGTRFRNTEVHTLDGEEIARTEVYFGWDLE